MTIVSRCDTGCGRPATWRHTVPNLDYPGQVRLSFYCDVCKRRLREDAGWSRIRKED